MYVSAVSSSYLLYIINKESQRLIVTRKGIGCTESVIGLPREVIRGSDGTEFFRAKVELHLEITSKVLAEFKQELQSEYGTII